MISSVKKALVAAGVGVMTFAPMVAMAQNAPNPFKSGMGKVDELATGAGIKSSQKPLQIVGSIINVVLSLLGLIFLLLTLYAGFLWMTAAGDTKKVESAQAIIRQAIIGLVVIMAGYAISNFVLEQLVAATGAGI